MTNTGIRKQLADILSKYLQAYPQSRLSVEGLKLYLDCLIRNNVTTEELEQAMDKLFMFSKFFPSCAEICSEIGCQRSLRIPSQAEVDTARKRQSDIDYEIITKYNKDVGI